MVNKSKIKGTAYETKIVKLLNESIPGITFIRTPLSGASINMQGDIMPKLEFYHLWPYIIECKNYAEVDWNGLLHAKSSDLLSFWNQALKEAVAMNKKPLVIYKWTRSKDFVCWNDDLEIEKQIHYRGFGCEFKMSLLEDWIKVYTKK